MITLYVYKQVFRLALVWQGSLRHDYTYEYNRVIHIFRWRLDCWYRGFRSEVCSDPSNMYQTHLRDRLGKNMDKGLC